MANLGRISFRPRHLLMISDGRGFSLRTNWRPRRPSTVAVTDDASRPTADRRCTGISGNASPPLPAALVRCLRTFT